MKKFGRRPFFRKEQRSKYKMNREITASSVRVVDEDGVMQGVMNLDDALRLARDKGLDLMEMAPNAKPPTCKVMDYGKWKYSQKKKESAARKKQVSMGVKEIQVRPRIEKHDLDVKLSHARRFLLGGDKVKVRLRFSGREMAHKQQGFDLINRIGEILSDLAQVEAPPKLEGRHLFLIMVPDLAKIKEHQKAQKSSQEPSPSASISEEEPVSLKKG